MFITLASHVAAMAPGTHVGAAHPVQVGGLATMPPNTPAAPSPTSSDRDASESQPAPPKPSQPSVMQEKLVHDAQAWARSLAELRGRNAGWAALSVSESRSITDSEAAEQHVVDLIAQDFSDLLAQIDGRDSNASHVPRE